MDELERNYFTTNTVTISHTNAGVKGHPVHLFHSFLQVARNHFVVHLIMALSNDSGTDWVSNELMQCTLHRQLTKLQAQEQEPGERKHATAKKNARVLYNFFSPRTRSHTAQVASLQCTVYVDCSFVFTLAHRVRATDTRK